MLILCEDPGLQILIENNDTYCVINLKNAHEMESVSLAANSQYTIEL